MNTYTSSAPSVEVAHDFTNGSFDHLADPRDDFEELLDSMMPAADGEAGPFDTIPHSETRTVVYMIGSVLRERVETVITNRPVQ